MFYSDGILGTDNTIMKRTKIILLIIITAGLLLVVYAGKRWYTHESEVNAKLWAIQTDTDKIAESLKGKEGAYVR